MERPSRDKIRIPYFAFLVIGAFIMLGVFVISLTVGQYQMTFGNVFRALFGNANSMTDDIVIWELRLPRTITACLVGMALGVAGLVYQSTFQNELASPDIIGVSSGASVGVALGLLLGLPILVISGVGFLFGALAMVLTLLLARVFRNKSPIMLIIAGVLISGLMGSIVSLIKSMADAESVLPTIVYWLMGSFASVKMVHVWVLLPVVICGSLFLFAISGKIINNVALGYEEAKSKGINYKAWRIVILIIGTILTASCVAVAGAIGWVGLVVPHIARLIVGQTAQKTIPITLLFGGTFMMLADILARTLITSEIPVGAITGIIGIAIFIIILCFQRGRKYYAD